MFLKYSELPFFGGSIRCTPPKIGRKMGVHLIAQMQLTWLAGRGGQWWSRGFFFFLFSSSKTQVCLTVWCILQSKKYGTLGILFYFLIGDICTLQTGQNRELSCLTYKACSKGGGTSVDYQSFNLVTMIKSSFFSLVLILVPIFSYFTLRKFCIVISWKISS